MINPIEQNKIDEIVEQYHQAQEANKAIDKVLKKQKSKDNFNKLLKQIAKR